MKLHFFGAAGCVTGSCYMVEYNEKKFLIDCGMFQGNKSIKEKNYGPFPFNPSDIDFVILTHAHVDHSGLLPKLVKHGFKGTIYSSTATRDLCSIVLPDSAYIQETEVERKNRKLARAGEPLIQPIYSVNDAYDSIKLFNGIPMKEVVNIDESIRFSLNEAGHILGASIIELWLGEKKIVFSGDLGNKNQPIIKDPDYIDDSDYLVIESTYGNRNHSDMGDKEQQLIEIIKDTFSRGGNLVIPAFAVERTQDLLYYLHKIKNANIFESLPIYVDSPLAIEATKIFCTRTEYYDNETNELIKFNNECPFIFDDIIFTKSPDESMQLNTIKSGAIIISASGMAEAGRIKHHLKHNIWREECTVLFVGYQAVGTLGRRIKDGEKVVRIHGEEIAVNAKVIYLDGFSAHADQSGLLDWLGHFKKFPEQVFVVHGEEESSSELARLININFDAKIAIPKLNDTYDLLAEKVDLSDEGRNMNALKVNEVFGEIIASLNIKVSNGLQRREYMRLVEKLYRIKDFIDKM